MDITNRIINLISEDAYNADFSKDRTGNVTCKFFDKNNKPYSLDIDMEDMFVSNIPRELDIDDTSLKNLENACVKFIKAKINRASYNVASIKAIMDNLPLFFKKFNLKVTLSKVTVGGADWSGYACWDLGGGMFIHADDECDSIDLIFRKESEEIGTQIHTITRITDYYGLKDLVNAIKKWHGKIDTIKKWET